MQPAPVDPAAWLAAFHEQHGDGEADSMPRMKSPGGKSECRRWRIRVLRAGWSRAESDVFVATLISQMDFLLDGLRKQLRALHIARRTGNYIGGAVAAKSAEAAALLLDLTAGILLEFGIIDAAALRCFRHRLADEQRPSPPVPKPARGLLQLEFDDDDGMNQRSLALFAVN